MQRTEVVHGCMWQRLHRLGTAKLGHGSSRVQPQPDLMQAEGEQAGFAVHGLWPTHPGLLRCTPGAPYACGTAGHTTQQVQAQRLAEITNRHCHDDALVQAEWQELTACRAQRTCRGCRQRSHA